jgi:hypothetical protein
MRQDVTATLQELLSTNRGLTLKDGAARVPTEYSVTCFLADDVVEMTLTFLRGRTYCCMESGCHLRLLDGTRWTGLRNALEAAGTVPPSRLHLRLTVVVEDGALFFDFAKPEPGPPGRYSFARSGAHRYEVDAEEAA